MINSVLDNEEYAVKELSFERPDDGEVNFIVSTTSGFNDSTGYEKLNSFFNRDYLEKHALDIQSRGGRGQALLFELPYQSGGLLYGSIKDLALDSGLKSESELNFKKSYGMCLRHYYRGGLVGKFIKDGFWRYDAWGRRARLEFKLLNYLYLNDMEVPRPLICREQVGSFFIKNDIIVQRIDASKNLAELFKENYDLGSDVIDNVAFVIAKLASFKVVHTDLNIRNILINDKLKVFLIDFDKCFYKPDFAIKDLQGMLSRLERSILKEKELCHYDKFNGEALAQKLSLQCLEHYQKSF